jgi:DnaK suppressor protein
MPVQTQAPSQPRWRALLETRWQARLRQVTELSLAYHDAAAAAASGDRAAAGRVQEMLRRAVAARRGLADVEDALARLAAGRFGRCEQCLGGLLESELALNPEMRYCLACAAA